MEWILNPELAWACRPGYSTAKLTQGELAAWLQAAKQNNIQTVLCLLTPAEQRQHYGRLEGSVSDILRKAGLQLRSVSVEATCPPVTNAAALHAIWSAYAAAPKPVLLHGDGSDWRTHAALGYILLMRDVTRIVGNRLYEDHPFRNGSAGMQEFATLIVRYLSSITDADLRALKPCFDQIEAKLCESECRSCLCKFCAYAELVFMRFPEMARQYTALYETHMAGARRRLLREAPEADARRLRDFRHEVMESLGRG